MKIATAGKKLKKVKNKYGYYYKDRNGLGQGQDLIFYEALSAHRLLTTVKNNIRNGIQIRIE